MDKFAIDLDKVLDDFEESEDRAVQLDQKSTIKDDLVLKNNLECVQNINFENRLYISHNVCDYQQLYKDHTEKLDLSEADFASALKPSTLLSLPIHHHNSLSQVDIKTKSFQNNSEKTHFSNDSFSDFNRWTKDLKDSSINNISDSTKDSDKYFTNGYVQNEEMLCISVQNTTNDNNDSFSSSDIKIQLLPSFSTEHFKAENDQNENMQNSNNDNEENCMLNNENQNCKSVDTNFNDSVDNLEGNISETCTEEYEEKCNVDAIESKKNEAEKIDDDDDDAKERGIHFKCKTLELVESVASVEKPQLHLNEDETQISSSNVTQDRELNENNIINNNLDMKSNNTEKNNISPKTIGFKDVEADYEDDIDIEEVDSYLKDILNEDNSEKENLKMDSSTEYSENNNEQVIESCGLTLFKESKFESISNEEIREKSQVNLEVPSPCKKSTEEIENENFSEIKDTSSENKDLLHKEEMGAKPKFMVPNTFENTESFCNEQFDKELCNTELSATNMSNIEITHDNFDQKFSEDSISSLKIIDNDKNISEKSLCIDESGEICQTYDKNGNLTNQIDEMNSTTVLRNGSFDETNTPVQPARLPRPTTLNLPVRVSMRPQVPTDMENSSNDKTPESIDNDGNETHSQPINPGSAIEERVSISEEEQKLGKIKPFWVPDTEASNCMHCDVKFTVIKRRHHCRACGKVLCSQCCNQKTRLPHLDNKEARVCQHCLAVLVRGDKPKGEPKQVMFSDGIRPGGDLTDQSEILDHPPPYRRQGRVQRRIEKTSTIDNSAQNSTIVSGKKHKASQLKSRIKKVIVSDSDGPLSPILLPPDLSSEGKPDLEKLINWLTDEQCRPIVFALTKNLHILAKIVKLDCCIGKECWCFTSNGLNTVGQDEVMVIIERLSNENTIPRDIFRFFNMLYDNASKGVTVGNLGHLLFPEGILGSREHSGFLFVRHTFQCLGKLVLPSAPFLIALLIQKWEVPWVKVFPLRLMLRLGAEFRYYPCPLISVRYRKPVYCEIGHTIMNLLADFRNYQFTIPMIPGVFIHMEDKNTTVNFPRNTYEKVMKVLSNSNDHVLALASNFSSEADSHLVCIQNEDGNYQTQAINIQNTPRRVTGSSFIVFSGALKASTGLTAKSSIVEDGLLVQIPSDTMSDLKNALRDMKDFTIGCGLSNAQQPEVILLQWTKDDKSFNIGVRSPIDNRSLEGIQSIRIHTGTDYAGEYHLIRWTEVFFLQMDESGNRQQTEPADPSRLAEAVAQACCQALTPHLEWLAEAELNKIGLRVTLDADKVGYDIGAAGEPLPSMYMNALDSALIPVITCASTSNHENPIVLELIFHVLLK
ncbi:zinc finger FYVE domain-containing protein 9 isoform X2 [Centruroides vittatus]|uniref:zinc finger FYVE domain-containing protein 9 isoform X2 n=1 Tax=Centruroides vittatus TaxID=120091 RepID=UPI00350E95A4